MPISRFLSCGSIPFADAIDVLSIIETPEAGSTPAAIAGVNAAHTDAVT